MSDIQSFDEQQAHRHFAVNCFNKCWEFLEKEQSSISEQDQMIALAFAASWHWSQRDDHTPKHLSIGHWQVSRVYAKLREGENAVKYGQRCLEISLNHELAPFYIGYAYEALARGALIVGHLDEGRQFLEKGFEKSEQVSDPEERKLLVDDLNDLAEELF